MPSWLLKVLMPIIKQMIPAVSADIISFLAEALKQVREKAYQSNNSWDDIFVDALIAIIGGLSEELEKALEVSGAKE